MICKICKRHFKLRKEDKYLVQKSKGLSDLMFALTTFEAFDCPKCGCQYLVNIREPEVKDEFIPAPDCSLSRGQR